MEEFYVELVQQYGIINLYSIRFDGEEHTEFEKFMMKYKNNKTYQEDLSGIFAWLARISRFGALERYFRPEGRYGSGVMAIPIEVNRLRLYCIRISDNILILGNGSEKDAGKWQESETLKPMVELLSDADRFIHSRFKNNQIKIDRKNLLVGNLKFKRKDNENK